MTDFEKMSVKMTWIRAGTMLFSACMVSVTFGVTWGDWRNWRKKTTEDVIELQVWKKKVEDNAHADRVEKNKNAKVHYPTN